MGKDCLIIPIIVLPCLELLKQEKSSKVFSLIFQLHADDATDAGSKVNFASGVQIYIYNIFTQRHRQGSFSGD